MDHATHHGFVFSGRAWATRIHHCSRHGGFLTDGAILMWGQLFALLFNQVTTTLYQTHA
jgi:hypothetical protein